MHPNADLLRAQLEALSRGDIATAMSFYSDDVVFHYPGRNPLSGDYRGKDQVRELLDRVMEFTKGTFRPHVHDILASDDHVAALVTVVRNEMERQSSGRAWTSSTSATASYRSTGSTRSTRRQSIGSGRRTERQSRRRLESRTTPGLQTLQAPAAVASETVRRHRDRNGDRRDPETGPAA